MKIITENKASDIIFSGPGTVTQLGGGSSFTNRSSDWVNTFIVTAESDPDLSLKNCNAWSLTREILDCIYFNKVFWQQ